MSNKQHSNDGATLEKGSLESENTMFFIVSQFSSKILSEGHPSREGAQEELLQLQRETGVASGVEIWESDNEDDLVEDIREKRGCSRKG